MTVGTSLWVRRTFPVRGQLRRRVVDPTLTKIAVADARRPPQLTASWNYFVPKTWISVMSVNLQPPNAPAGQLVAKSGTCGLSIQNRTY